MINMHHSVMDVSYQRSTEREPSQTGVMGSVREGFLEQFTSELRIRGK